MKRILVPAGIVPKRAPTICGEWSDERIALLRKFHGEGFSASQIAHKLGGGLSRNAVIGKLNRLSDLPAKPKPAKRIDAPRAPRHALAISDKPVKQRGRTWTPKGTKYAAIEHTAPPLERFAEGYLGQSGKVAFLDILDGQCRFPIDQAEGPPRYCGDAVAHGSNYCRHHHGRCRDGLTCKSSSPDKRTGKFRLTGAGLGIARF